MAIVKMLETRKGTDDGFTVKQYYKGETYEVSHTNAAMMIGKGWAEIDVYSDIKESILSINDRCESEIMRQFWHQFEIDRILNSKLEESQKIELLTLTKKD